MALLTGVCVAQGPAITQDPSEQKEDTPRSGPGEKVSAGEPKPYDKVITKEAKTKRGLFTVHQVKQRWYYEIPKSELNKDFLWVVQFTSVPQPMDRGERPRPRVVRWERNNNKIYLRERKFDMVADPSSAIAPAVAASNSNTIHAAFNVEAWGADEAAVIDVTSMFTADMKELGPTDLGKVDASRSFISRIATFPANIEVETALTASDVVNTIPAAPGLPPGKSTISSTYLMHTSMVRLPEKPMMPRVSDDRVGYFNVRKIDFSRDEQKVVKQQYIARWRLEKKDPNATVSEPVKPIVYYVDPATPKKWVPYIKASIESWQVAFEAAGFKNAIIAKDAPTPEQDPDWSAEDVRNTIIRWIPSTTENARGPHIADPRSGEILNGNILVYHNILNLMRQMYFSQVAPLDARAQKMPLPDDLMGKLLGYVVTHEIGHTLGLRHNMKASSQYPAEKLRDREWVHKMGHTPSLMDYSRFNYVAQPEDGIDVNDLIPGIGPYDKWAISWGYKPIPGAKSMDDEKPTLNAWAREQEKNPYLRHADDSAVTRGFDPGEQTEATGDSDAVKSTALGLKNLERVSEMLISASSNDVGEPYEELQGLYTRVLRQWSTEMGHVLRIVGGVSSNNKHVGQEGTIYAPIPAQRQREAVKFLSENAFIAPRLLLNPEVLNRINPVGGPAKISEIQANMLAALLEPARIERLQNLESVNGNTGYSAIDLISDVHTGIWKELRGTGAVKVDNFRRHLQRSYVDYLAKQMQSSKSAGVRPYFRGDLVALRGELKAALPRTTDPATRMHLNDIQDQIAEALDPKRQPAAAPARSPRANFTADQQEEFGYPLSCWPDLE
ncbi:MAG TPA: zinc-dependent metalloprotease [Clostridia bacterium]|nr:zinc-dependent metalloprotease [Clostridia bacterium]